MGKTLTPELILMKCKIDKLTNLKNLNLWGNDLEDIQLISEMPNLEICSLSLNKIQTLRVFSTCRNLSELYLRKNLIFDLLEVKYLTQCQSLKVLWLQDNPIAEHPLYRQYVVKLLPNLIKLDSAAVTPEERQEVSRISITDQDIINKAPTQNPKNRQVDETAYHKPSQERPRSVNPQVKPRQDFINAGAAGGLQGQQNMNMQPASIKNQQEMQINGIAVSGGQGIQQQLQQQNNRNENILCAVLALLKELDENGLELVKRDIERKIQQKRSGQ